MSVSEANLNKYQKVEELLIKNDYFIIIQIILYYHP